MNKTMLQPLCTFQPSIVGLVAHAEDRVIVITGEGMDSQLPRNHACGKLFLQ